jgi:hypothetical protein
MSFFYGVDSTAANTSATNSSQFSPFDKVILPGHHFKNPFITGTIAIVVLTMISLIVLATINHRVPYIPEPPDPDSKTKYNPKTSHLTDATGAICFWYIPLVSNNPFKNFFSFFN